MLENVGFDMLTAVPMLHRVLHKTIADVSEEQSRKVSQTTNSDEKRKVAKCGKTCSMSQREIISAVKRGRRLEKTIRC
jgi:ribosomal protein S18